MRADSRILLETKRMCVRRFRQDDICALAAILADREVMRFLETPFDLTRSRSFLSEARLRDTPLVWAAEWKETGVLVGYIIFHPWAEMDIWEIGWVLARKWWDIGLATELTSALIRRARDMDIAALAIECVPEQEATARIAAKHGFHEEEPRDGLRVFMKLLNGREKNAPST